MIETVAPEIGAKVVLSVTRPVSTMVVGGVGDGVGEGAGVGDAVDVGAGVGAVVVLLPLQAIAVSRNGKTHSRLTIFGIL